MRDPYTLEAMRRVPREEFVDAAMREFAYEDSPLPIEAGQTISQPYIVALMIDAADSGRATACSRSAPARATPPRCMADDRRRGLRDRARAASWPSSRAARLRRLGYDNIEVRVGDGTLRLAGGRAVRRDPRRGRRPAKCPTSCCSSSRPAAGW